MTAHKRMGLPAEENIETIQISAPPLPEQVPKTFVCTKMICEPNCVHCYSEKLTEDMRQQLLASDIPVQVFYDF